MQSNIIGSNDPTSQIVGGERLNDTKSHLMAQSKSLNMLGLQGEKNKMVLNSK